MMNNIELVNVFPLSVRFVSSNNIIDLIRQTSQSSGKMPALSAQWTLRANMGVEKYLHFITPL